MQQAERREVREKAACSAERSTPLIMVASWKQLFFHLLLLLCCRLTQTKSAGPSAPPEPPSSPLPTLSKRVVLKGDVYMERVEVVSPVILELECNWTGDADRHPNVTGFWSKDGTEIEESRLTVPLKNEHYHLQRKFNIVSQENLGNYSCVFGGDAKINFVLAAPQMGEVRDKPIVSYVGDTALITCKMEDTKPPPTTWIWYQANGTEKEQILAATESQRHEIKNQERKTQLVVHNLTEADSGSYFCSAVYAISSTLGHVELKVITFYEPLKPFMAIVIEVTVLVAAILLYEKSRSKKTSSAGNEDNDQANTLTPGENDASESNSSVRQRKM